MGIPLFWRFLGGFLIECRTEEVPHIQYSTRLMYYDNKYYFLWLGHSCTVETIRWLFHYQKIYFLWIACQNQSNQIRLRFLARQLLSLLVPDRHDWSEKARRGHGLRELHMIFIITRNTLVIVFGQFANREDQSINQMMNKWGWWHSSRQGKQSHAAVKFRRSHERLSERGTNENHKTTENK